MATVKINCPKCAGEGLTGTNVLGVCSQCKGAGTIQVDDTQSLSTLNGASASPIVITVATTSSTKVASVKTLGK